MAAPFRLQLGDSAPRQQSATTCGSSCLTVARMLVNPAFAQWITRGIGKDARDPGVPVVPDGRTPTERFAAYEQVVAGRTNAVLGAGGRLQPPWPRALGTPPWGVSNELEYGASDPEADYDLRWIRLADQRRLERVYAELQGRVRDGRPAALYIGNAWAPRHVVLVMPATAGELDVYEPSIGQVVDLPREAFVTQRLMMAGWDVPWALVWADSGPR